MASPARRDRPPPARRSQRAEAARPLALDGEVSGGGTSVARSDARRLQAALESRYRSPAPTPRWSRRRTLAFVIVTSAALWGAVIAAVLWGKGLIPT